MSPTSPTNPHPIFGRRQFLAAGVSAAAALATSGTWSAALAADSDPYAGFKMGIQSYSLRHFKVDKALQISQELGLKYWEAFPGHIPASTVPKYIAEQQEQLKAHGVKLVAFGVVGFDDNEAKARSIFEFAKAIGIETLSADPKKNDATFSLLEKLVAEYGVNIAIHNHGPNASYDKVTDVLTWVKDRHPRIGACVDTGHYLRSRENPVEVIEKLSGRVFGVHFKDVKDAKVFKIVGEGDLDILGCLKALKAQNYQNSISLEYEENPENPVADLQLCLQNVRAAAAKL